MVRRLALPIETIRELWLEQRTSQEIADFFGCSRKAIRNAMARNGIPSLPAKARPEHNFFWRGGRVVDADGYILIHEDAHHYKDRLGYVREHRLVMEQQLGRFLMPGEVVDHIDGNKAHNALSNLRLFARNADHLRATLTGRQHRMTPKGLAVLRRPKTAEVREKIRQGHLRRAVMMPAASQQESGNGEVQSL